MNAAYNGCTETSLALVELGAKLETEMRVSSTLSPALASRSNGLTCCFEQIGTALSFAASKSHGDTVKALVKAGANVDHQREVQN
jgi:ankyrin repeat protein